MSFCPKPIHFQIYLTQMKSGSFQSPASFYVPWTDEIVIFHNFEMEKVSKLYDNGMEKFAKSSFFNLNCQVFVLESIVE